MKQVNHNIRKFIYRDVVHEPVNVIGPLIFNYVSLAKHFSWFHRSYFIGGFQEIDFIFGIIRIFDIKRFNEQL